MKRARREELSLNLTPLIDVVFLLLIFFMVTTTFTKESRISLTLPEANAEAEQVSTELIEVTVGANSAYALDGTPLANNDAAGLRSALSAVKGSPEEIVMVVTADANAPHQAVVRVLDVAGSLGFVNVSISTQKPAE